MRLLSRVVNRLWFLALCAVWYFPALFVLSSSAYSQSAPLNKAGKNAAALIQKMVGTWNVEQRMWPGYGAKPVPLPAATAQRRLVGGMFLSEVMELKPGSSEKPFTRTAYFNFNTVSQQYEYVSLDTRAPQMMQEKSHAVRAPSEAQDTGEIKLYGGRFVAAQWGKATNVAFTYRLTLGEIENDNQIVRLYLTPQAEKGAKEFLAFEYRYTRQH